MSDQREDSIVFRAPFSGQISMGDGVSLMTVLVHPDDIVQVVARQGRLVSVHNFGPEDPG